MPLEKTGKVRLVGKGKLLGDGRDCLSRVTQEDLHLRQELLLDELLGRAAFKALCRGSVEITR